MFSAHLYTILVGGDNKETQFDEREKNPDIIANPGRIMHHLAEVDDLSLRNMEYVGFYEARHLFDMGSAY